MQEFLLLIFQVACVADEQNPGIMPQVAGETKLQYNNVFFFFSFILTFFMKLIILAVFGIIVTINLERETPNSLGSVIAQWSKVKKFKEDQCKTFLLFLF